MQLKNFRRKSHSEKSLEKSLKRSHKKSKLKTLRYPKGGSLVCFRGSGHRVCFGRVSGVSSMFWICVVQVEQLNKKVDISV